MQSRRFKGHHWRRGGGPCFFHRGDAYALLWLAGPRPASAQVRITGAIAGTVIDASDLTVPGAIVQLQDERTGIEKTTTTNTSGAFVFPDLNFGSYQVTVSLQGFRTVTYSHVVVEASRTTDLRIKLELGQVGEAVTVIGADANITSTTFGQSVQPINGARQLYVRLELRF